MSKYNDHDCMFCAEDDIIEPSICSWHLGEVISAKVATGLFKIVDTRGREIKIVSSKEEVSND